MGLRPYFVPALAAGAPSLPPESHLHFFAIPPRYAQPEENAVFHIINRDPRPRKDYRRPKTFSGQDNCYKELADFYRQETAIMISLYTTISADIHTR